MNPCLIYIYIKHFLEKEWLSVTFVYIVLDIIFVNSSIPAKRAGNNAIYLYSDQAKSSVGKSKKGWVECHYVCVLLTQDDIVYAC